MVITVEVIIKGNKLVIKTEPKTFDLSTKVDNNQKHKLDFITRQNEFLAEQTMKNEIS